MAEKEGPVQFAPNQRSFIWAEIASKATSDDRDPNEVMREDFGGNEDSYLAAMVQHLNLEVPPVAA